MEDIISMAYARKSTREAFLGKIWYLPYHGVYHPNKTGKIRVVFDLSGNYKGRLINRELLFEPDLTNQIAGVLLWFREEQVAVMGDTEAMFHQVKVPVISAVFLDFCGGISVIPTNKSLTMRRQHMCLVGASSPSCSNFKKAASDNRDEYASDVTRILERNFYVDAALLVSLVNGQLTPFFGL